MLALTRIREFMVAGIFLCFCLAGLSISGEESTEELFRSALKATGDEYVLFRGKVAAKGDEAKRHLENVLKTSQDWRECAQAMIFLGWIENPELYADLWDWKPPPSGGISFQSHLGQEAMAKFGKLGGKAGPLVLDLLMNKKHPRNESRRGFLQTYSRILPKLLAEWKVEVAIPVLVDLCLKEVGDFGDKATVKILEALKQPKLEYRKELLNALGRTNDRRAIPALRTHLLQDAYEDPEDLGAKGCKESSAEALFNLGRFDVLREDYQKVKDTDVRRKISVLLGKDSALESRNLLFLVSESAEDPKERASAIEGLTTIIASDEIPRVVQIVSGEKDENAKASMLVDLKRAGANNSKVRELCLEWLKDKSELVRIQALGGLANFNDDEVTRLLLDLINSDNPMRKNARLILSKRISPLVGKQAFESLKTVKDGDVETIEWCLEVFSSNPVPESLELLKLYLCHENEQLRYRAILAITKIGGEKALKTFRERLKDERSDWLREQLEGRISSLKDTKRGE